MSKINYNERADKRITNAVNWVEKQRQPVTTRTFTGVAGTFIEGFLNEDLDAPDDEEDYTEAEMRIYRGEKDEWQQNTIDSEEEVVVVRNRDINFSADEDDRIACFRINGEWRPFAGGSIPKNLCIELFGDPQGGSFNITIKRRTYDSEGNEVLSAEAEVEIAMSSASVDGVRDAFVDSGLYEEDEIESVGAGHLPVEGVRLKFVQGAKLKDCLIQSVNTDDLTDCCHRPYARIRRIGI